jgi:hypothetical protein
VLPPAYVAHDVAAVDVALPRSTAAQLDPEFTSVQLPETLSSDRLIVVVASMWTISGVYGEAASKTQTKPTATALRSFRKAVVPYCGVAVRSMVLVMAVPPASLNGTVSLNATETFD